MANSINYKKLLKKYIEYVGHCEGTDFITLHDKEYAKKDANISPEEFKILIEIAKE